MTPPSPYDWLIPILVAPFIGSFLAVVAIRLPEGESIVAPRSHCPACGRTLRAIELVPIVSWVVLRNRCSSCGAAIGWFYPVMELAAVGVAVWASLVMEGALLWVTVALGWTLLALAAMDIRSLILADALTLPLIAAGLIVATVIDPTRLWWHGAGAAVGFALMVGVAFAYRSLRGRDGLGFGDAKLMAAAGAWAGLEGIGGVLLYAAASGLAFATLMRMRGQSVNALTEIPLGAGIALGLWLVWLYGPLILGR